MLFSEIIRMAVNALRTNKKRMEGVASAVCLKVFYGGRPASYNRTKIQGLTVVGTNEWFLVANSYKLAYGRNIGPDDVEFARGVCVVGRDIEKKLFPNESP